MNAPNRDAGVQPAPKRGGGVDEGASLVEYGLLLGLIAVAAVLAVAAVGLDVFDVFDATHQELGQPIEPTPVTP